jgi:hypothetical protein
MRSTQGIYLCIAVINSLFLASLMPGSFPKSFAFACALHLAAASLGWGYLFLKTRIARVPWNDRATLKRAAFHVVNAAGTGAWAWYAYRPDFLAEWFLAFIAVGLVGGVGSLADLTRQFEAGYNPVLSDLKSGEYPRVRTDRDPHT